METGAERRHWKTRVDGRRRLELCTLQRSPGSMDFEVLSIAQKELFPAPKTTNHSISSPLSCHSANRSKIRSSYSGSSWKQSCELLRRPFPPVGLVGNTGPWRWHCGDSAESMTRRRWQHREHLTGINAGTAELSLNLKTPSRHRRQLPGGNE